MKTIVILNQKEGRINLPDEEKIKENFWAEHGKYVDQHGSLKKMFKIGCIDFLFIIRSAFFTVIDLVVIWLSIIGMLAVVFLETESATLIENINTIVAFYERTYFLNISSPIFFIPSFISIYLMHSRIRSKLNYLKALASEYFLGSYGKYIPSPLTLPPLPNKDKSL